MVRRNIIICIIRFRLPDNTVNDSFTEKTYRSLGICEKKRKSQMSKISSRMPVLNLDPIVMSYLEVLIIEKSMLPLY